LRSTSTADGSIRTSRDGTECGIDRLERDHKILFVVVRAGDRDEVVVDARLVRVGVPCREEPLHHHEVRRCWVLVEPEHLALMRVVPPLLEPVYLHQCTDNELALVRTQRAVGACTWRVRKLTVLREKRMRVSAEDEVDERRPGTEVSPHAALIGDHHLIPRPWWRKVDRMVGREYPEMARIIRPLMGLQ